MDEKEMRLAECFLTVFPDLTTDMIPQASSTSLQGWDSVAMVTLLAVVEEEFGVTIEIDDPGRFASFKEILTFLREHVDCGQRVGNES